MELAPLKHVIVILTYTCQLRCKMCGQVDAPIEAPNSQLNRDQIDFDLVVKRLSELPALKSVYLFGGEPLLYRKMFPLLNFLREKNIDTTFSTNGLLLEKYAKEIVDSQVGLLSVSIDSHKKELHDEIRGLKGSYDHCLESLDAFLAYREQQKSKLPRVKIHFTITPDNYQTMLEYYDHFTVRFPLVDLIKFHFPRFATVEMGKTYDKVMKEQFGVKAMSWLGNFSDDEFNKTYAKIDTDRIYDMISELLTRSRVSITGPTSKEEIREFFKEPGKMPAGRQCGCFKSVAIQPNGDVVQCADYPDLVMGNIKDKPLQEIWENDISRRWKEYLNANGNPGVLAKCSRLYPWVDSPAKKEPASV
jgi:MoaA/NifB/PqqE/SkfB family radical SAM enzyme